MEKIVDHSQFSWMGQGNRMVLSKGGAYEPRRDKDGLTLEQRRKVEEMKDKINRDEQDWIREVWE